MPDAIVEGLPILVRALQAVGIFKYPLVALGAVVEGPILTVASGFLLHTEVFRIWPLFLALCIGDLVGDAAWYCIGRWVARPVLARHGRFLTLTPELFEKLSARFHEHHAAILFISKVTMGLGMALALLMAAGASRIPFRAYMFWNTLGEIVYVAALLVLGYFFGELYRSIAVGFKTAFTVFGGVLILAGLYFFTRHFRKRAVQ